MGRNPYLEFEASRHLRYAQLLREQFPHEEDGQALADTLEGMTNFFEALDLVMNDQREDEDRARVCEAEAALYRERAKEMDERAARLKARCERTKERVLRVLDTIGQPSIERPTYTISRREGAKSVIVTDVTRLPVRYLRQKPAPAPEPDKPAIAQALKSDDPAVVAEVAAAAVLTNGNPRLDVRRK